MAINKSHFITQKKGGETYLAYLPPKLPLNPPLDINPLHHSLEKAVHKLAELNAISHSIPNTALFIYMYVRKEALLSSQIEGTQGSLADLMLFEHSEKPNVSLDDIEEVSNYVEAMNHGLLRLKNNFPLSLRLMKEMHAILLAGSRGANKQPGEFRRTQNWIGGTRPGNALFVPPPPEQLTECLGNLEHFLYDKTLPTLINIGIAHVQFESTHPFLDGNGRLGRLLITLLLCTHDLLDMPILYLSLYFKQHQEVYYQLSQEVRTHGRWVVWLEFFLNGIYQCAKQAIESTNNINQLFATDLETLSHKGRRKFTMQKILVHMQRLPQVTVSQLSKTLEISLPAIRAALADMENCGIIKEVTGTTRKRIYVYQNYLHLLEQGL